MRAITYLAFAVAVTSWVVDQTHAASFTIDDWDIGIGIAKQWPETVGDGFFDPINPFVASHSVVLGSSTASASYDFAWWNTNGMFLIQSTQQAEGVPTSYASTGSSGGIWVTPSVDLTLAIDASWTYDLPGDPMFTRFKVRVSRSGGSTVLFHQEHRPETLPGEPASGTLDITGNVILPPGAT